MTKLRPLDDHRSEARDAHAIAARVTELFAARLGTDVPTPDTDLFESGIVDSLRFVELLVAIEETFGVHVSVEELEIEAFRSVTRIARFLASKAPE